MSPTTPPPTGSVRPLSSASAGGLARYGLVIVIAWIGALKFTEFEANGIAPLVSNSPLMSWVYDVVSVGTFSALLGVLELGAAALIAVKPWWPRVSMAGSVIAVGLFTATLSFLFTTRGGCSRRQPADSPSCRRRVSS